MSCRMPNGSGRCHPPRGGWPERLLALVSLLFAGAVGAAASEPARSPSAWDDEVATHPAAALRRAELGDPALAGLPAAERCRFLTYRGEAELNLGRVDAARDTASRLAALAQADSAASCPKLAAKLLRAELAERDGDPALALELLLAVRSEADPVADYPLWARASLRTAADARSRAEYDVALRALEEVATRAKSARDDRRLGLAYARLSDVRYDLRLGKPAMADAQAAWQYAVAAGSPWVQAEAKLAEAAAAELADDQVRDRHSLEQALAIARAAASPAIEQWVLLNFADYHLRHAEFAQAREVSQRALAIAGSSQATANVGVAWANLGFAEIMLGSAAEGRNAVERGLAIYERGHAVSEHANLLREYGNYLERSGDETRALAAYRRERELQEAITRTREVRIQHAIRAHYEAEAKTQQIELLRQRNELQATELGRQRLERMLYAAVAVSALLGLIVVLQLYRRQRASADALAERNRSLAKTRDIDPLTGLFNRRHFHEFMRAAVDRERRRDVPAEAAHNALLLLDLDHFKRINDRYGHAVGDAVLVEVARRLRDAVRDEDRVVRWGGEEFLIHATLRPGDRIHDIAGRLLGAIGARSFVVDGLSVPMTTSIGYLAQPLPPDDVELAWRDAFDIVDMALYLAKAQGRNRGCGIVRLARGSDGGLPDLGHDLAAAAAARHVDLHFEPGPVASAAAVDALVAAA